MALNMLKRTMELLGTSAVNTGKNYFRSVGQLADDSKAIMAESKDFVSKPLDFIRRMSTSRGGGGLYKTINDWFYQRADEYDQYDLGGNDDDGFDSGMPSSVSGTPDDKETPATIDVQSMKDIARGQVGAMYKIGQKQVQAGLANTSEIVSSFNNRSSEIVASINNLNKTVLSINENLTKITSFYVQAEQNKHNYGDENNPFDAGNLEVGKIFNTIKTKAGEHELVSQIKQIIEGVKSGPQFVTDFAMQQLFDKITINDKSLKEQADSINERFGRFINDKLAELITSKGFTSIFGNLRRFNLEKPEIANNYNTNKAVFDGMTRKTIIDIIPGYLSKITSALTGQTWNIDQRGEFTTRTIDISAERLSRVGGSRVFGNAANKIFNDRDFKFLDDELANDRLIERILSALSQAYAIVLIDRDNDNGGYALTGAEMMNEEIRDKAIKLAWESWNLTYGTEKIDNEKFGNLCKRLISHISTSNDKDKLANEFKNNINQVISDLNRTIVEEGAAGRSINPANRTKLIARSLKGFDNLQSIASGITESQRDDIKAQAKKAWEEFGNKKGVNEQEWLDEKFNEIARRIKDEDTSEISRSTTIDGSKKNIGSIVYNIYELLRHGIRVRTIDPKYDWQDINAIKGNGLNLDTNGCGPIALTDLANRMAYNGLYDPRNGTSVGNYISAASQMGIGLYPGKVTQRSLRNASPYNPITVMGSGYGFGTGIGQYHYMNIIGADDANAYTYNPMFGNGAYPLGAIANNSVLGLYGRGKATETVDEGGSWLKKEIAKLDPNSKLAKFLYIMGFNNENIDEATGTIGAKAAKAENKFINAKVKGQLIGERLGDYFTHKKEQISNDFDSILTAAKENYSNRVELKRDAKKFTKGINAQLDDENNGYSDKDKQYAQIALSMMNAAIADGDGTSDLNAIKKTIGKIKNSELRSSLESNIVDLINRSAKKTEAKPKSKFGKLVVFGVGLLKKFLSPVFKGAKLLFKGLTKTLSGGFKFITDKLPKLVKWLAKPYKSSAALITTGFGDLKKGLFGGDEVDEHGNLIVDENGDVVKSSGLFTPIKKLFDTASKGLKSVFRGAGRKAAEIYQNTLKPVVGAIGNVVKNINESIQGAFDGIKQRLLTGKDKNGNPTKLSKLAGKIFKEPSEGKKGGFFSGFRAGLKDVKNSYARKFEAKTLADANSDTLVKLLTDVKSILKGEDPDVERKKQEEKAKLEEKNRNDNVNNENATKGTSTMESIEDMNKSKSTSTMPEISTPGSKSSTSESKESTGNNSSTLGTFKTASGGTVTLSEMGDGNNVKPGGSNMGQTSESAKSASLESSSEGGGSVLGGGGGGSKFNFLGKLGKMLSNIFGGSFKIILGIGKAVLTAIMQLKGLQTLISLVQKVFNDAVKPLNKLIKQIIKAVKPILNTLKTALHDIMESVVQVVSALFEILIPILKPLAELFIGRWQMQIELIVGLITDVVGLISPAIEKLIKIVVPIIQTIHGIIETAAGALMFGLGRIIYGIGWLVGKISDEAGDKLKETGNNLAISGREKFYGGLARQVDAWASPQAVKETNEINETNNTTNNIDNSTTTTTVDNSTTTYTNSAGETFENVDGLSQEALVGLYGSGDSQSKYGFYLNMKDRGCGPVALAENINRRNKFGIYGSGDIDPAGLASSMYNAGMYDTNRGTSVRDYLMAGNALGYDMRAGGVDYRSLKQASPTNPITLVGSGNGFGTRQGNTHYINVVGTDGVGFAYVSNPLTGKVSKAAANDLIHNSKLGIYGSGDEDEKTEKSVGQSMKEAAAYYDSTTSLGDRIIEAIPIIGDLHAAKRFDEAYEKAKVTKSNLLSKADIEKHIYDNDLSAEQAEAYRYAHDASYTGSYEQQQRANSDSSSATDGLTDLSDIDFSAESIAEHFSIGSTISDLLGGLKNLASNFLSMFSSDDTSTEEGQQKWLKRVRKEMGDAKFDRLRAYAFVQFAKAYPPTGLESFTPGTMGGNIYAARFKLHEYEYIKKYKDKYLANPNSCVITTNDLQYLGIDTSNIKSMDDVYDEVTNLLGGITSDLIEDTDIGGTSTVSASTNNSASTSYDAQGHITTTGTLLESNNAFTPNSKYANNPNVSKFIEKAKNAGMTPAEIATIISTGIWEDGGEKIFGSKSITATTYDYNGQRAEGIMNWVSGSHATTIAGQLSEIHNSYFNPGSHWSAVFRHNEYDNQDIAAYKAATGRSGFNLNWGEKYGDLINTDLVEGSEHFFRSSLVPASIHNSVGVGNYVGTAVGAYNWMLDKGYFTPTINSGSYMSQAGSTGNVNDLISSVAMIYEGYTNANPKGTYLNYVSSTPINLRNGRTRKIRPDCSGIVSAGIQEMGYKLKGGEGESGARSQQFTNHTTNDFILDQNGNPSSDWIVMPFSRDALQPGDITSRNGHVSMPIINLTADWPKGLDGGGTSNIKESAVAAKQYLNGADISSVKWRSAMGPKWNSSGGATKIWRYLGGNLPNSIGYSTSGYSWNDGTSYSFDSYDPSTSIASTTATATADSQTSQSTGYDDRGFKINTDYDRYKVKYIGSSKGKSEGYLKNSSNEIIASIIDANSYSGPAADQAVKGKKKMSAKWNTGGREWWYYDTLNGHELYGAGDSSSSLYIPELNSNFLTDSLLNSDTSKSVNNYYIAKNSSDDKQELITTLLKHTFNVRSDSMEAILTEMLNELRRRGSSRQPVSVPSSPVNMFDESIPSQIEKLMMG